MTFHDQFGARAADVYRGAAAVDPGDEITSDADRRRIADVHRGGSTVKAGDEVPHDSDLRCRTTDVARSVNTTSGLQVEAYLEHAAGHVELSRIANLVARQQGTGGLHRPAGDTERRPLHKYARRTVEAARAICVGGGARKMQGSIGDGQFAAKNEQNVQFGGRGRRHVQAQLPGSQFLQAAAAGERGGKFDVIAVGIDHRPNRRRSRDDATGQILRHAGTITQGAVIQELNPPAVSQGPGGINLDHAGVELNRVVVKERPSAVRVLPSEN